MPVKAALKRSRRMEKKERRARPLDAGDEIKGTKWTGGEKGRQRSKNSINLQTNWLV